MLSRKPPSRRPLSRFRRDRRGVAAVEFAMMLPIMLLLFIGVVDVTRGVIASRKLNLLSRTLADLVSQEPTAIPTPISEIQTIFAAASAVMAPYGTSSLKLTVSAVDIKAKADKTCCDALVRWSFTQSGTLRGCTTALNQVPNGTSPAPTNFPAALVTANQTQGYSYTGTGAVSSYVIVADASYTYAPLFRQAWSWFSAGINKTTFMVPRAAFGPVTIADPSGVASPQSGKVCF